MQKNTTQNIYCDNNDSWLVRVFLEFKILTALTVGNSRKTYRWVIFILFSF